MMDYKSLIITIVLGVILLATVVFLCIELFNGNMKKFVIEKIAEAEKMFPKDVEDYQEKRRNYVIETFKEKYKIMSFCLNVQKFIELICKLFKPKV